MKYFFYLALTIKVATAITTCDDESCTSYHNGIACTFDVSQRCNGIVECSGLGFDEDNCTYVCVESSSLCSSAECNFARSELCDGQAQCPDRVDEIECLDILATPTTASTTTNCRGFTCGDGRCLPFRIRCDGFFQCPDRSDEQDCPPTQTIPPTTDCNGFTCDNGQCIPSAFRCDGFLQDCSDGSDERDCIFISAVTVTRPNTDSNNKDNFDAAASAGSLAGFVGITALMLLSYIVYKFIKVFCCMNSPTQQQQRLHQQQQRLHQQHQRIYLQQRGSHQQQRGSRQQQRGSRQQQRGSHQQQRGSRQQQQGQNRPNLAERTAANVLANSYPENPIPMVPIVVVVQDLEPHPESELLKEPPPNYESSALYPSASLDEEPPSYESISDTALNS